MLFFASMFRLSVELKFEIQSSVMKLDGASSNWIWYNGIIITRHSWLMFLTLKCTNPVGSTGEREQSSFGLDQAIESSVKAP